MTTVKNIIAYLKIFPNISFNLEINSVIIHHHNYDECSCAKNWFILSKHIIFHTFQNSGTEKKEIICVNSWLQLLLTEQFDSTFSIA